MMKDINKKNFLASLGMASVFVGGNKILPILTSVRLQVLKGVLRIYSSDSNNHIGVNYGKVDSDDINICIDYHSLSRYVRAIPDPTFSIEVISEENSVKVSHSSGSIILPFFLASDFPEMPNPSKANQFKINSSLLSYWISSGEPFLTLDEFKPQNSVLYLHCESNVLSFCCTDTSNIITADNTSSHDIPNFELPLHMSNFPAIRAVLGSCDEASISYDDNNIFIIGNGAMISIRKLSNMQYYKYRTVFAIPATLEMVVDRDAFLSAVNRCSVSASKEHYTIQLSISKEELKLSCADLDGRSTLEKIPANGFDSLDISLNVKSLLFCLKSMDKEVSLTFRDNRNPVFMNSGNGFRVLTMPIF